jgi:hypothetical protein
MTLADLLTPAELNEALHAMPYESAEEKSARGVKLAGLFDEIRKCAEARCGPGNMLVEEKLFNYRSLLATLDYAIEHASKKRGAA